MSGVCARCEGTGSVPIDYDPYTNGWTTVECPDCMDPALPEEPEKPERYITCDMCGGDGDNSGDETAPRRITCPKCQGDGRVENPDYEPELCGLCGAQEPRPGFTACRSCAG